MTTAIPVDSIAAAALNLVATQQAAEGGQVTLAPMQAGSGTGTNQAAAVEVPTESSVHDPEAGSTEGTSGEGTATADDRNTTGGANTGITRKPLKTANLFQRLARAAMSTQAAGKGGEAAGGTGQPRSRQANLFRALIRIARMTGSAAATRAYRPLPGFYLKTRLNQVIFPSPFSYTP
jgi:hypothetical protein